MTPDLLCGRPVSGVYQDYVEPLVVEWATMRPRPNIGELNRLCRVPWTVWNGVVLADFYPQVPTEATVERIRSQVAGNDPAATALVEFWIERKRSLFEQFRYLFGKAEFYQAPSGEVRSAVTAVSVSYKGHSA